MVGGEGNDILRGGRGRDIIIGGDGSDFLRGRESDILISGATAYDRGMAADREALGELLGIWRGGGRSAVRLMILTGMTRGGGWARFNGTTLLDDEKADTLIGTSTDVLFASMAGGAESDILVGRKRFKHFFEL